MRRRLAGALATVAVAALAAPAAQAAAGRHTDRWLVVLERPGHASAPAMVERLLDHRYQLCILDPEGDYSNLEQTVCLGDPDQKPTSEEVASLLSKPEQNAVVNLLAVRMEDRPAFFDQLLPRIQQMRSTAGHPHWLIVDEAHHLIPALLNSTPIVLPQEVTGLMMITMKPKHLAAAALKCVDVIIAIGEAPEKTLQEFADIVGTRLPLFDARNTILNQGLTLGTVNIIISGSSFAAIANQSLWETIRRSLATTFITLLPVSALLVFGGDTLKDFAFALLVGIGSGAYSTIFIATPLLTILKERESEWAKRRGAGLREKTEEEPTDGRPAVEPEPEPAPEAPVTVGPPDGAPELAPAEEAEASAAARREARRKRRRARPHGRTR